MKKIILCLLLAIGAQSAFAASADSTMGKVWDKVSASDNFHLLDNAMPASFYDFKTESWYAGGTTSLYTLGFGSLDFGGIKPTTEGGTILPMLGLNLRAKSRSGSDFELLNNLALGFWYCREFTIGLDHYGVFGGYSAKF